MRLGSARQREADMFFLSRPLFFERAILREQYDDAQNTMAGHFRGRGNCLSDIGLCSAALPVDPSGA
jgi:hypothetical protein